MIHIHCPNCQSRLEIDPGFAGGICRCFNCGTLMTVPATQQQQVEQLQQSDRPDRPDSPDQSVVTDLPQTFVTQSGREINLDRQKLEHVPVARKRRMGLRVGLIGGFIVFVIFLVVGLVYLMDAMTNKPTGPSDTQIGQTVTVTTLGYDPAINPYQLDRPNFFGLPVSGRLVAIIDASSRMNRLLDPVKDLVVANLRAMGSQVNFQAIFVAEAGPVARPPSPQPASTIALDPFNASLDAIRPGGRLTLRPAVTMAVKAQPDRLMIVVHDAPPADRVRGVAALLKTYTGTLDVVLLGPASPALKTLAEQHGGRVIAIAGGQLQRWHDQFRAMR